MNKIEILKTIEDDMRKDAERFDGQPFTGKTVAEYFGCQGAAIATLARILREIAKETEGLKKSVYRAANKASCLASDI